MSENKHTPWAVGPHPWPEQVGCCPLVGRPYSVHGTYNRNVAAANTLNIARLISAAPEMLEALSALDRMSRGVDWCDQDEQARRWAVARAAIAKAEGRS